MNNVEDKSTPQPASLATSPLTRAADHYPRIGARILPAETMGKRPVIPDWQNRASVDPKQIIAWATEFVGSNVGWLMGQGKFTLDVDGDEGRASLAVLTEKHGKLPPTVTANTPSGGMHIVFATDLRIPNSAGRLGPGLDVRGEAGFIVVSPSVTPRGRYKWVRSPFTHPILPAPSWLLDLIGAKAPAQRAPRLGAEWVQLLNNLNEGSRNDGVARIAGLLFKSLPAELAEHFVRLVNKYHCKPSLGDREVNTIIDSIARRELAQLQRGRR